MNHDGSIKRAAEFSAHLRETNQEARASGVSLLALAEVDVRVDPQGSVWRFTPVTEGQGGRQYTL